MQVCPHQDRTSLLPVCTSLIPQPHSEEVEVWREARVGRSDRQGAESIDFAEVETDLDLEAVVGVGTLAGAPRLPRPTYS